MLALSRWVRQFTTGKRSVNSAIAPHTCPFPLTRCSPWPNVHYWRSNSASKLWRITSVSLFSATLSLMHRHGLFPTSICCSSFTSLQSWAGPLSLGILIAWVLLPNGSTHSYSRFSALSLRFWSVPTPSSMIWQWLRLINANAGFSRRISQACTQ